MARFCKACGRSLDEDGHDLEDVSEGVKVETPVGTFKRFLHDAYNTRIQQFPGSLIAGSSFQPKQFFEITDAADREVPQVKFS